MSVLIVTILLLLSAGRLLAAEALVVESLISFDGVFDDLKGIVRDLLVDNFGLLLSIIGTFFVVGLIRSFVEGRKEQLTQVRREQKQVEQALYRQESREAASRFRRYRNTEDQERRNERLEEFQDWLRTVDPRIRETYGDRVWEVESARSAASFEARDREYLYSVQYFDDGNEMSGWQSRREFRTFKETDKEYIERYFSEYNEPVDKSREVLKTVVVTISAEARRRAEAFRRYRNGEEESEE
jgi:hypothetical protein